ncbi:hypothetical protein B0A50_02122 [Salinomyces thailandicus]|uniref:Altered inheritance of mitochondria protein 41 n=1 Tax=Salinomyces thailandicus TaxID=706561 RepID=A0A4U0U899_9PEZI|nr:hypothetical protein B0A50_02122 [Salinomyces thailandica]
MASRLPLTLPRNLTASLLHSYATSSSTTAPAPPLLLKLRRDLKTAMQTKDTTRLNVLRSLLADVTNAAKSPTPLSTDVQLLSLLRKRAAAGKAATEEFKTAGREDLVEREESQVKVMEEYAGGVETVGGEEIRGAVVSAVEAMRQAEAKAVQMGEVMKKVLGPGGGLEGKPVERGEVARVVKEILGGK